MDMNDFFAMGFCKAAEEHGVDPVQLVKYAADTKLVFNPAIGRYAHPNSSAGIGSYGENRADMDIENERNVPINPRSYIGRLLARHPGMFKGVVFPDMERKYEDPKKHVSLSGLEDSRRVQAILNAEKFYPRESAPFNLILNNLINAGKENHKSYLRTGDTKERAEPNLKGIEKLKLTPDQRKELLQMQNTMVQNSAPHQIDIV